MANEISSIAKPRQIMVVEELPKTRSGKIMRRLLRDIAENRELGDVTTLTDSTVMDLIKENLSSTKPGRRGLSAKTADRRQEIGPDSCNLWQFSGEAGAMAIGSSLSEGSGL